jgi:sRNA-binding regulator protein Hfq
MYEPEKPDDATPPGMGRVFDDLEAEFDAGLRREAEQETTAAVRAEVGSTVLWEQLARRVDSQVVALAGGRTLIGRIVASYPEFLVLRAADGAEHLIHYGHAVSFALPAEPPVLRPAPGPAVRRYQFSLALRELARRREPVRVDLSDGTSVDGTIEAVGSDYLEVAEHDPGEARRRAAVRARRFVGFAAVAAVSLPPARR